MKQNLIDIAILLLAICTLVYCLHHLKWTESIYLILLVAYVAKSLVVGNDKAEQ